MNTLALPGATLHYQVRGDGPLLLLLPGGDGDADSAVGLVDHLAAHFTVVTHDRRGLARSPLDDPSAVPAFAVHAQDALRLVEHLTDGPVAVVGFSLGALVGLDLLARHPDRVTTLVAHEPPATQLLPDAEREPAERAQEEVGELVESDGVAVAMQHFLSFAGMRFDEWEDGAPRPTPAQRRPANLVAFLRLHAPQAHAHRVDLPAVLRHADRLVPAAGATSTGFFPRRCAEELAAASGRELSVFPGAHSGFLTHPAAFADRLRAVL
ncbi:alpha/beta fold hydrolase [Actinosynnema sp. NPDC020468]|uniref:alpha/beta fold hydrolase n=1 Tax=Actinosynnema sp. NPDC020468 TaxID=3154488 RepID=UPI0033FB4CD9